MKKIIKYAIFIILFCLFITEVVYFIHYRNIYKEDRYYQYISSDKGIHISHDDIEKEDDILGSYVRKGNVSVKNGYINRKSEATLLIVDFDFVDMLGQYCGLYTDDKTGCVISSYLSYELYGTENGSGNIIMIDNVSYTVRNVIDSEDSIMIRQIDPDKEDLDEEDRTLLIDTSDELYRNEISGRIITKYGISNEGSYYVRDYQRLFPGLTLPSKWSDFDKIAEGFGEIKSVKNRMTYGNKDILELQYYKNYNIMKRHCTVAIILMILWIPLLVSEIRCLLRK